MALNAVWTAPSVDDAWNAARVNARSVFVEIGSRARDVDKKATYRSTRARRSRMVPGALRWPAIEDGGVVAVDGYSRGRYEDGSVMPCVSANTETRRSSTGAAVRLIGSGAGRNALPLSHSVSDKVMSGRSSAGDRSSTSPSSYRTVNSRAVGKCRVTRPRKSPCPGKSLHTVRTVGSNWVVAAGTCGCAMRPAIVRRGRW